MVPGFVIEPLTPGREAEVVRMLARAFVTNPIHAAALGVDDLRRNESFFRAGLPVLKGVKIVALQDGIVVGFNHWARYPGCIISPAERLRLTPALITGLGLAAGRRTMKWVTAWAEQHPVTDHVHLGPIGVEPSFQGKGVGRRLMEPHLDDLDALRVPGYLETDRPANVAFYEHFGYRRRNQVSVLGVPNFFMLREPGAMPKEGR
jgi:predicted N-acetyltransferase YhbS